MKPLINLDEVELGTEDTEGDFHQSWAPVASVIGAKKLGYNLTVVPPGKKAVPYHNHRNNEEMFLILEGRGTLRFGGKEYPVRRHDVIACPPGGREVAHQIVNTGDADLKYLAVSTMDPVEIAEFPDSDKILNCVGHYPDFQFRHICRADQKADYMDGES